MSGELIQLQERVKATDLTDHERRVLDDLAQLGDGYCVGFGHFGHTGLSREEVRAACRSLTDKGLANWAPGLRDEDGMAAGSGYGVTLAGMAVNSALLSALASEGKADEQ